jgi:hypothetical protein
MTINNSENSNPPSLVSKLYRNEVVKQGAAATARLLINGVIVVTDIFPPTEAVSWLADLAKMAQRVPFIARRVGINLDLTPDVSATIAVGSEVLEIPSGGFFPSHGVETLFQLRHDAPRIARGVISAAQIVSEHRREGRR